MGVAIFFLAVSLCRPTRSLAASPFVNVSPQHAEIPLGQEADILITVDDVADLYGLDVRLSFDPGVLEAVDLDAEREGVQVEGGQFPHPDFVVKNEIDNDAGTIWYAVTQLNPREPANGSGTVITIRFRGKATGASTIDLTHVEPVNRRGEDLVWDATGGEVLVSSGEGPTPTPLPPSDTPEPSPAQPTDTPVPPTDTPQPTATTVATATAEPGATEGPTAEPSAEPTAEPTATTEPSAEPTAYVEPTEEPTAQPTATSQPTAEPTAEPVVTADLTTQAIATAVAQGISPTPTATAEPTAPPTAAPTLTQPQPTDTPVKVAAVVATVEPTPAVPPKQETARPPILEGAAVFAAVVLVVFLLKKGVRSAR